MVLAALALLAVAHGATSVAAEPDQVSARIIIYPLDGTIRAAYRLAEPTTHFRFAEPLDAIRSKSWSVKTPGLTLNHDVVTADNGQPFREFTIAIKPDDTAFDRVYPALFKVGADGLALFTPYLAGERAAWQSFVEPKLPGNVAVVAGSEREIGVFGMLGVDRYIYLGPADYVHRRDAVFIVPPDLPSWIDESIEARMDGVLKLYETRLGRPLPASPEILMAYADTPGASRYRGDVSAGLIMALRFRGHAWHDRGSDDNFDIVHLIAHESFHLWNGQLFNSRELAEQPWLHEGSAEYAALLTLRTIGELKDEDFRDELETRINHCREDLGGEPLRVAGAQMGNVAYDCGVVIQWVADLAERRDDERNGDFFTLWRDIFAQAVDHDNVYGVDEFEAAVPPAARPIIDLILDQPGAARWDVLPEQLKQLGIDMIAPAALVNDDTLRRRAVLHLLIQACGPDRHGFATEPGFLQLDTGPGCGALAGDPAIASAEGHDLFRDMPGAFAAMAKKCGSPAPVTLGGERQDENYVVACPKPMPTDSRYILSGTGLP
jgi:hypothetical protein